MYTLGIRDNAHMLAFCRHPFDRVHCVHPVHEQQAGYSSITMLPLCRHPP